MLREIVSALKSNTQVVSQFAELCEVSDTSKHTHTDAALCFQFCLLVYGRVRAKDLARKYNSNLYRGQNAVNLRSGLAAHTKDKGSKKKRTKKRTNKDSKKKDTKNNTKKMEPENENSTDNTDPNLNNELNDCLDELNEELECNGKLCLT